MSDSVRDMEQSVSPRKLADIMSRLQCMQLIPDARKSDPSCDNQMDFRPETLHPFGSTDTIPKS